MVGFISTTTSTALVGYLINLFSRVLDFKSRSPWFNYSMEFIFNINISSLPIRYNSNCLCPLIKPGPKDICPFCENVPSYIRYVCVFVLF